VSRLVQTQRHEDLNSVPAVSGSARKHSAIDKVTLTQRVAANASTYAKSMRAHEVSNFPDPNGQGTNSPQCQTAGHASQSNLAHSLPGRQP
jgi:hypothetical protein